MVEWLAYLSWTDCNKPSRLLVANALFRSAEKFLAIMLAAFSKGSREST